MRNSEFGFAERVTDKLTVDSDADTSGSPHHKHGLLPNPPTPSLGQNEYAVQIRNSEKLPDRACHALVRGEATLAIAANRVDTFLEVREQDCSSCSSLP